MVSKGDKYTCEECGIILAIDDPCGCTECDLICCDVPMKPLKVAKKKK